MLKHFGWMTLAVSVAACGGGGGTGSPAPTQTPDQTLSTDEITVSRATNSGNLTIQSDDTPTEAVVTYNESSASLSSSLVAGDPGQSITTQTGSARFTGDYVGLIVNEDTETVSWAVTGDTSLTVNFTNRTVNGGISNRRLRDPDTGAVDANATSATLTLGTTSVSTSNNLFAGDATGGGINGRATTFGTYNGQIVLGADQTAAGVLSIEHVSPTSGAENLPEFGSFTATR